MRLDPAFLSRPIAHRGYHDRDAGRPENSIAAAVAAIEAGYGIELDLQLSADGRAMVFHDYDLGRCTAETGAVALRSAGELARIALFGTTETIPTFADFLKRVDGRVPLLIEIKDQDGAMGPNVGRLEQAMLADLHGYRGPLAIMSFNPHSIAAIRDLAPDHARGLTTSAYDAVDWAPLPAAVCDHLRDIPDFERVGADFISHEWADLARPRVAALKAAGVPILCWTVKSAADDAVARHIADNVTFESYAA